MVALLQFLNVLLFLFLGTFTNTDVGGITFYYGDVFYDSPLSCPGYTYSPETPQWAAFPTQWYASGRYQCGDVVRITYSDGSVDYVLALDSCPGCLDAEIWDTGKPFVADLPIYWRDGKATAPGMVENLSLQRREMKREPR